LVCKDGFYTADDRIMSDIGSCNSRYGPEAGKQNPNCIFYCHGEALGILNSKHLGQRNILDDWIKKSFPKRYSEASLKHIGNCWDMHGHHMGKSDTDCKNAKQFLDCMWSVVKAVPLKC